MIIFSTKLDCTVEFITATNKEIYCACVSKLSARLPSRIELILAFIDGDPRPLTVASKMYYYFMLFMVGAMGHVCD